MKIVELIDTLTGFEEIGIEQVCGKSLDELTDTGTKEQPKAASNSLLVRALAAVVIARRDETQLKLAWSQVLKLSRAEVADLFPDEDEDDEEVLEDEPVTESGKDDSDSTSEPVSSPLSSSTPG